MTKTMKAGGSADAVARALAPPVADTQNGDLTANSIAEALAPRLAEEIANKLRIQLLAGDDALLTPAEAREFLRRSDSTLEFWRSLGIGPRFVRLGARGVAYRLGDLRAYIADTSRGLARLTDIEIAGRPDAVSAAGTQKLNAANSVAKPKAMHLLSRRDRDP
jgi:hypothetical protein